MKRCITTLLTVFAIVACKTLTPEEPKGAFRATFIKSQIADKENTQIAWAEGDIVVLSNCTEDILFEDGTLVPSSGAECIMVTGEMISKDGYSISFDPTIASSKQCAILTARSFEGIKSINKDGSISMDPQQPSTELNYVASAVSKDGRFSLKGVNNYFSITVADRRARSIDISVGYSDFEVELPTIPSTYYFAIPTDELISDGIYASVYDDADEKILSEHFENLRFAHNQVVGLGVMMDFGDMDRNIISSILKVDTPAEAVYDLEGEVLKRYLDEVQYDDDYSYTKIKDYAPKANEEGTYRPAYVEVKGLDNPKKIYLVSDDFEIQTRLVSSKDRQAIYALIPGHIYKYGVVSVNAQTGKEVLIKKGCFETQGRIRYIKTTKYLHNFRDIGGWEGLDGKHIRYGLLIRGSEVMNKDKDLSKYEDSDYEAIVNHVGVDYDLDFRTDEGAANCNYSPLGLEFRRIPLSAYESIVLKKDRQGPFKSAILQFIKNAKAGKCTYVHCQGGADRTGTFVFFIEGLVGVSDSDLCKDYEITSFYYHKERNDPERYLPMVQALLKNYSKDGTVGNGIYNCALSMGLTEENINDLRNLLLE